MVGQAAPVPRKVAESMGRNLAPVARRWNQGRWSTEIDGGLGDMDRETRPGPRGALDGDDAVVLGHDAVHYRKAEPAPHRPLGGVEGLEDVFHRLRADPGPRVLNGEDRVL